MKTLNITITLFFFHLKRTFRHYVPNHIVRVTLLIFCLTLLIGGIIGGVVLGLNPPPKWSGGFNSKEFIIFFSGLLFMFNAFIIFLPIFLLIKGVSNLLESSEISRLILLSPISYSQKMFFNLGPVLFLSCLPFILILIPFFIMFTIISPTTGGLVLLYFLLISTWTTIVVLLPLFLLIEWFGRERGLQIMYFFPFILFLFPVLFSYAEIDLKPYAELFGYWQIIILGVLSLFLPFIIKSLSKILYGFLTEVEPPTLTDQPTWGTYEPWKMIERKTASWGLIPTMVILGLMVTNVFKIPHFHQGLTAYLIIIFISTPFSLLLSLEVKNLQRWEMAPNISFIKKMIWLKVGIPMGLLTMVLIIFVGFDNVLWSLSIMVISVLAMMVNASFKLAKIPLLQNIIFFLLMITALCTQVIWNNSSFYW